MVGVVEAVAEAEAVTVVLIDLVIVDGRNLE